MRKLLLLCLLAISVQGCIGMPGSISIKYFSIVTNPTITSIGSTLPKSLWVLNFQTASRYGYAMLFRTDAYGIGYKEFDRWIERPEEMVQRVFANVFVESHAFQDIVSGTMTKPTDYMMDGYIMEFDEVRGIDTWHALFTIKVTVYRTLQREAIWYNAMTSKIELPVNQSGGFAKAMSDAVFETAAKTLQEVIAAVKKDAGGDSTITTAQ